MHVSAHRIALALPLALAATAFLPLAEAWVPRPEQEQHEESPLGQAMEHMNAGLRKANRALEGGDTAAALEGLAEFQTHVISAKAETPPKAATVPEAERAAFVAAYRATLIDVLRISCDVEQALVEGRLDDARVMFAEKLRPMEKTGHERFTDDEY
ncbi:MAG TPA: cytochrome b562 [Planctomycetota bacterium]|nr:cytochrome b562 [Planctomycetota bacterium]